MSVRNGLVWVSSLLLFGLAFTGCSTFDEPTETGRSNRQVVYPVKGVNQTPIQAINYDNMKSSQHSRNPRGKATTEIDQVKSTDENNVKQFDSGKHHNP